MACCRYITYMGGMILKFYIRIELENIQPASDHGNPHGVSVCAGFRPAGIPHGSGCLVLFRFHLCPAGQGLHSKMICRGGAVCAATCRRSGTCLPAVTVTGSSRRLAGCGAAPAIRAGNTITGQPPVTGTFISR